MQSNCLPLANLPHQTRLFTDFIGHFDRVQDFYARPALAANGQSAGFPAGRRSAVADVLERQNHDFGAGAKTLENLQRLREGAAAVVTGQQVALFGGPLFSLLKAVTVVNLAEKTGAVPVFWMATEDHDFSEVNFVQFPAGDRLRTFTASPPHVEGAPAGSVAFGGEIATFRQQAEELFGASATLDLLCQCYRPGETFGAAFGNLYARLFSEFGLILLDPSDVELHRIAQPVFSQSWLQWKQINEAIFQRDRELEAAGYHAQVKITPSHTLSFYVREGVRVPIRHDAEGFVAGDLRFSERELMAEAEKAPERFNANVLLRPIMQDYLLPTLCYVGGPAEIAYFAQAEPVYRALLGKVTPIVPRVSATLIEPRQAKLLERYHLQLTDTFCSPEQLRQLVAGQALPESIMKSFDAAAGHLEQSLAMVQGPLQKLDPTLADAAENAGSKMRYQLQSLRNKAARSESRKNTETQRHADELSTLLYPNKNLQEREIGSAYFLLKHGAGLLQKLKEKFQPGCPDHQIVFL